MSNIAPFCDLDSTGRLVVCQGSDDPSEPGPARGIVFGGVLVSTAVTPMFVRCCLAPDGACIAAAKAHDPDPGPVIAARSDGRVRIFDLTYGNCVPVIQMRGQLARVAWVQANLDRTPATHWAYADLDPLTLDGAVTSVPLPADRPDLLGTSDGIKDLDEFGQPIWMLPVNQQVGPVTMRYAVTRGNTTIGQWIDGWEDQLLIERYGQVGTLWRGLASEPHLTEMTTGELWAVWRDNVTPRTLVIPDVLPPFLSERPIVQPTFGPFNHAISIAPFHDPAGEAPSDSEVLVNGQVQATARACWAKIDSLGGLKGPLLGLWTEGVSGDPERNVAATLATLAEAEWRQTRVAWTYDEPEVPLPVPSALRPCDQVWLECYRLKSETLQQSQARWRSNLAAVCAAWPGDIGLIAQFYNQGGDGISSPEVWTTAETLDGLSILTELVNSNPRVKVVAPFEWSRANGITAHLELRTAFEALVAAAGTDRPNFVPVPSPIPDPPEEPAMPVSNRIAYRVAGTSQRFQIATFGPHQDAGFQSLTREADGAIVSFDAGTGNEKTGKTPEGVDPHSPAGSDERIKRDAVNPSLAAAIPSDTSSPIALELVNL